MKYIQLDKGTKISRLGLGAHIFNADESNWYESYFGKKISESPHEKVKKDSIEKALECGINLIACDFRFEYELTGKAVRELAAEDDVVINGCVEFRFKSFTDAEWKQLESELDELLKILMLDRLDIINIRLDRSLITPADMENIEQNAESLKDKGKIRFLSLYCGDRDPAEYHELSKYHNFDLFSRAFGFLMPGTAINVFPVFNDKIPFIAIAPFQKGWFFECAKEVSTNKKWLNECSSAAIRWMLNQRENLSVLVGITSIDEIDNNAAAVDTGFSEKDRSVLRKIVSTQKYQDFKDIVKRDNPGGFFDWNRLDSIRI